MNLTIKKVPDHIGQALKRQAFRHGRSLNAEIVEVLSEAAQESERRRKIVAGRNELERFVAKLPKMSSSVPLIREDRRRR
jgi:plasmid stability protein